MTTQSTAAPTSATNSPTAATPSPTDLTDSPTAATTSPSAATPSPTDPTDAPTLAPDSPSAETSAPTNSPVLNSTDSLTQTSTETTNSSTDAPTETSTTTASTDSLTTQPSDNPSRIPTRTPISTGNKILNINVTIQDGNTTEKAVIASVTESVNEYFDSLETSVNYDLSVSFIDDKTEVRIIVFDLYILEGEDVKIDEEDIQKEIQQDLDNDFGTDNVVAVVSANNSLDVLDQHKSFFQQITIMLGGCLLLMIFISWVDAKYIRINDFYRPQLLLAATLEIVDTVSDALFAFGITYHADFNESDIMLIFIASMFFIITPIIMTLFQLNYMIDKHWSKSDDMRSWLSSYVKPLYALSIISRSSFTALQICRSNLFGQPLFDIPLNRQTALHFNTKRIYSITLLEVFVFITCFTFSKINY